jgi:hypothetical protein
MPHQPVPNDLKHLGHELPSGFSFDVNEQVEEVSNVALTREEVRAMEGARVPKFRPYWIRYIVAFWAGEKLRWVRDNVLIAWACSLVPGLIAPALVLPSATASGAQRRMQLSSPSADCLPCS